jgi:hypothetical protein
MSRQEFRSRVGRRLLGWTLGALALALAPGAALAADACGQGHFTPIHNCVNQVHGPMSFTGLETASIIAGCVGDGMGGGNDVFPHGDEAFAIDNTCFTATEDVLVEGGDDFVGTFTNWCVTTQQVTITLACSDFSTQ